MKPHVTCHMLASVDGRVLGRRWRPRTKTAAGLFEQLHEQLGCDAWIVGRVTGQEFAKGMAYPPVTEPWPPRRGNHVARQDVAAWGVVLDAHGRIAWGRSDIGGDPILVVLTEAVSDSHLAGLRSDGVSYIFAGKTDLDLAAALETLNRELGVGRVLLEGGGVANGAFLRAGLVDALSLVICPAVDGARGAPCVFDSGDAEAGVAAPLREMRLDSSTVLEGGAVWLRYTMVNESTLAA